MNKTEDLFIFRLIDEDGKQVAARLAEEGAISRQAASARLSRLKRRGLIETSGHGRGIEYFLATTSIRKTYRRAGLSEELVWRELCAPALSDLADNVKKMWHHGVTEMINNAVDHSGSKEIRIVLTRDALRTTCQICDEGEGIFLKIQKALYLYDARESILELAKGKFTTDSANHSGEGIFFTSKMFDTFLIESGGLSFFQTAKDSSVIPSVSFDESSVRGTTVAMTLEHLSQRSTREVFDAFAQPDDFSFAKTIVPVKLAQYEDEALLSRSQAKRLTRCFERFQTVVLNFSGVSEIGQAFADEVFRVFVNAHAQVRIVAENMSPEVALMVRRVSQKKL